MKLLCQSICIVSFMLFFSACCNTAIKTTEIDSGDQLAEEQARDILFNINKINDGLTSFKGIGDIMFLKNGRSLRSRIAICGARPENLRIVTLTAGRPDETFATNGKHVYLLSHSNAHPFIKKKAAADSLEKLLAVPIKIDDLIDLLTGRIPIYPYASASWQESGENNNHILVLKKRRQGTIEKIYLDESRTQAVKIEIFDSRGGLMYCAAFDKFEKINGYTIPLSIIVSNAGAAIQLTIDKYWPDTPVSPDMFVLYSPDKNFYRDNYPPEDFFIKKQPQ